MNHSLADIELIKLTAPPQQQIAIDLLFLREAAEPYETFIQLVTKAINYAIKLISQNPKFSHKCSEDEITEKIVSILKAMAFSASHDTMVGGHVDICINQYDEYLWLGEAKKIDCVDNHYLKGGILQLLTRYESGDTSQNQHGFLIYCNAPNLQIITESWAKYLPQNYSTISVKRCTQYPALLKSVHPSIRIGNNLNVTHFPASIYFNPQK